MLIVFSISREELIKVVVAVAVERFTAKQKKIIKYIDNLEMDFVITVLVDLLSEVLGCSKTTIWNNLNQLKKIGIISSGDIKNKGLPVKITNIGRLISKKLEDSKDE